jgi:hypothetical protein
LTPTRRQEALPDAIQLLCLPRGDPEKNDATMKERLVLLKKKEKTKNLDH